MEHAPLSKLDGWINFRVERELKNKLLWLARSNGFRKLSDYLRREVEALAQREGGPARGKKNAA